MKLLENKRNGEIDFLRFIFAILILVYHFNNLFKFNLSPHGYIGVEFFFIVSGFLMAQKVDRFRSTAVSALSIPNETWIYTINRIKSFYMFYVSAIILQIVIRNILINHMSFKKILERILLSLPTFSLTFNGLTGHIGLYVGNTWFLSSLVIASFIFFPLLLKSFDFSSKILLPIVALVCLAFLDANDLFHSWNKWIGWTYNGLLRGIADLALGISMYPLANYLSNNFSNPGTKQTKILATVFKALFFIVPVAFALSKKFNHDFALHATLYCAIGVALSFSSIGYTIKDCKLTRYLGKLALPLFIYHGFIRWSCYDYVKHKPVSFTTFCIMIVGTIITSIILMHITEYLSKLLDRKRKGTIV